VRTKGRTLALCIACCLFGSGCTGLTWYERGLPKRVEITKTRGAKQRRIVVQRVAAGTVEIVVLSRQSVQMRRRVVHNTIIQRQRSGNPLLELVEIPFGVAFLPIASAVILAGGDDHEETPTRKPALTHNRLTTMFGFLNPFFTVWGSTLERDPNTDKEVFFSAPRRTNYSVSLPVTGAKVGYTVRSADQRVLAQGTARTDWLGRVVLLGTPTAALHIDATTQGAKVATRISAWPY